MRVLVTCPKCNEDQLKVVVEKSGSYYDQDWGTINWWSGKAKCKTCGYVDENFQDQDK